MTTDQNNQNDIEFQVKFKQLKEDLVKIDLLAIKLKDECRRLMGKFPFDVSNLLADFNIQLGIAYNNLNYNINKIQDVHSQKTQPPIIIKEEDKQND